MTTLPQTTAIRVPRPSSTPLAVGGPPGGAIAQSGQAQLNSADVWRVIRSNLWLILVAIVLSAAIGYTLNWWLARYHSRYTAVGLIQIQPATPLGLSADYRQPIGDNTSLAVDQKTHAALLMHESLLI